MNEGYNFSPFGVLNDLERQFDNPRPNSDSIEEEKLLRRRPASAPSTRRSLLEQTITQSLPPATKKYSLNPNRLSSQDWSKVIRSLKSNAGRYDFLKKSSSTRSSFFLSKPSPNDTGGHDFLAEYEQKKKEDEQLFQEQLRLDRESDQLLLHRCIQECNEFCDLLKRPIKYEYLNDSFVLKKKLVSVSGPSTANRQISTSRFYSEHNKLLQEYKNRLRGKDGATPPSTFIISRKNSIAVNNSAGGNGSSIFNLTTSADESKDKSSSNKGSKSTQPQTKLNPLDKKNNQDRKSPERRRSSTNADSTTGFNHNDLNNELQRRKDVSSIQQRILSTMEEEEDLILEQIEFIHSQGWNL